MNRQRQSSVGMGLLMLVVLLVGCAATPPPAPTGDPAWLRPEDRRLYHYLRESGLHAPDRAMFERVRDTRAAVLAGRITKEQVEENIRLEEERIMREMDMLDRMDAATPAYQPPFYFGQYNLGRFGNYTCTTMPQFGWQTCNAVP